MVFVNLLCLFTVWNIDVSHASTHWMVTESGLIQPRLESPFELARPYDLLSFLNQESHWDDIFNLYNELSQKQVGISNLWTELSQETDINRHFETNNNCLDIGLVDWYSSFLDDGSAKGIERDEYSLYDPTWGQDKDIPDCKKISSLTYSMFTFDHLESVMNRVNLTLNPEKALPTLISPMMTVDQFGHWVSTALKGNTSSWLHYNLASLYWRIRGNAHKAIECCRRALHYAPRRYKDIPMLSLGIILHRSKAVEDAITVLNAAVDHDPQYYLNHFILANAYAVYGDFHNSIEHIEKSVILDPTMGLILKHKNAISCYAEVTKKMDDIKVTLHQLRKNLKEYTEKEANWLKAQGAFLKAIKHMGDFDYRNVEKNCQKMSELTGLDIKTLQDYGDKFALIKYFLEGPMNKKEWLERKGIHIIDSLYSLQNFIKNIEKHITVASDFIIHLDPTKSRIVIDPSTKEIIMAMDAETPEVKSFAEGTTSGKSETRQASEKKKDDISEYESGFMMYPITMKINRNSEEFDKDPEWPSDELCLKTAPDFPPNVEAIFPVFLPFENKGIRLKSLLTEKIGVPISVEHELPWHPPICPQDKDSASFIPKKTQKQQLVAEVVNTGYLRDKLLEYVGDGNMELASNMQEAEIGQRIYAATQMNLAPKWIVLTLSSLYWRVRGNNINALHCLFAANRHVPPRYRDLVLVSLASIYLEMGYFDESLVAAEEAFRLSLYEPATNFILAELNLLKKHRSTHMFHLKQVVRVEGNFMKGLGRNLLYAWGCILKQAYKPLKEAGKESSDLHEGDVCTQVEPGMNVVCEKSGDNCRMTNMQCHNRQEEREGAGSLNRMLGEGPQLGARVDARVFEQVAEGLPARGDYVANRRHFTAMLRALPNTLKGCGTRPCTAMTAEDVSMRQKDCKYYTLQLGYWLQVVSFKQLITDPRLKIPPEIVQQSPSNRQYPECQIPETHLEDFFVEKMMQVPSERWEPTVSLMHQLAELFEYFDYVLLGAKIAKYVESNPGSWVGAFAAGWWCGGGGRGACAVRCLAAAHAHAPPDSAALPLRALAALLHMQGRSYEGKEIAYLSLYSTPQNSFDAFVVGVSHTYLEEFDEAIWMYRYALEFDDKFMPAKACLHAAMCLMFYGEEPKDEGDSLSL